MPNFDLFKVRVEAKDLRRRKIMLRVGAIVLLIAVLLLALMYFINDYLNRAGRFTVDVMEPGSLSISDNRDFNDPTTYLMGEPYDQMDNITEEWLPADIDEHDGAHNGKDYIAYTFYARNVGEETIGYRAYIDILSSYKHAEEAIRVKIYKNGEPTLYAMRRTDNNEPEPGTVPFYSDTRVMDQTYTGFVPGQTDKYTVVIWLEGWDPECVNNILEGSVKMAMKLEVTDGTGELGQGTLPKSDTQLLALPTDGMERHFKINLLNGGKNNEQ